ncbi:hypothetical protein E3N88_33969 [Mikania micrantha]|uniref:Glutamate receptor n=1 Tax=Mikania micrantha TaxID=192012 RepID=A0A5N6MFE8_9ASTR|nr:hypothetical protein E3N88_33969 [Mikania micrantha]
MSSSSKHEIPVGVILDMKSLFGQMVHSSILMAISDFYFLNDEYKTRLVLHTRDSKGDTLQAISVASDLLENLKVQAIIGPESLLEAKFLSILGNKTKVPVLSLIASSSFNSNQHCYLLQMPQDETIQWKGLAALTESFKWTDVILIHEDSEFGRESIPYMIDSFLEKKIHISYKSAISSLATDDQIVDELRKLSDLQENVVFIHCSHYLAFRILVYAKRVGLMDQGYAWIVTDKTMNFFDPMELDEEVVESFQGVLGLKYLIPSSNQLNNFTKRWRKETLLSNPNIFSLLAYDAIFALGMAVERVESRPFKDGNSIDAMDLTNIQESSKSGMMLLKELLNVRFKGLSGEFHLLNRKSVAKPLEIVNVFGKGEKRVGFWTEDDGITMYIKSKLNHRNKSSINGLASIIWPGGSMIHPTRRLKMQTSKTLRIGVPMLVGFEEFLTVEHNPQTNATIAKGFCVDVFDAAVKALSYEVPYEFVPFVYNKTLNSEAYNQLIHEVYLQKYDAVVGDTTITANRSLYVDFTIPYTELGVGTVIKDDQNSRKLWWFLEPLDTYMWVVTTLSFFIIAATIWFLEHHHQDSAFRGPWHGVVGPLLWFSFSTLTFSQRAKLSSNLSRLLVIVWLFIVLVMITCYNAALSSMLTIQQIRLTQKGIDIGYHAGSFVEGVIVNNSNFKDPSLLPYTSLAEYKSALEGGRKKGGVVAIMDELPYIKLFLAKYGTAYRLVSYEPSTNGFGFVFPKGSQLASNISREISKLREEGELLKLEKKWFKRDSSYLPEDSQEIDAVMGDSTILANRSEYVDFTATYTEVGVGTLVKMNKNDMWFFVKPLEKMLWISIGVLALLTCLIIWVIESLSHGAIQPIGATFWVILMTFFLAQRETLSSKVSKFVLFVWLLFMLILISSYTATLSSILTVEQFETASKGGTLGFHGGSFEAGLAGVTVSNLHFEDHHRKPFYSYEDYAEALTKGGKDGGANAIIDEIPYIKMFLCKYSTDYAMISSEPSTSGFAFAFRKGSRLAKDMSRQIAKIREDGSLRILERKWFQKESVSSPADQNPNKPKALTFGSFKGLFIICGSVSAFGLLLSVLGAILPQLLLIFILVMPPFLIEACFDLFDPINKFYSRFI